MMKMTKKEVYSTLIQLVNGTLDINLLTGVDKDFLIDKLNHEIELLEKKNSSKRTGMTKTQKENADIKEALVSYLKETGEPMRVGEILKDDRFSQYSSSRITALLSQLVSTEKKPLDNPPLIRTEVKKVAYYSARVE